MLHAGDSGRIYIRRDSCRTMRGASPCSNTVGRMSAMLTDIHMSAMRIRAACA